MTKITQVLLVEDEKPLRETLQEILSLRGFEVITSASGEDALEVVNNWTPDLIICDIMMPGISGFDVLREVQEKEELKQIPFVFLSALASAEDKRKGFQAGAKGYITKPFNSADLISLIQKLT